MQQDLVCWLCQNKELQLLVEKNNIPILKNRFYPSRNIAEAALTNKLVYWFCPKCVFAFNPLFNESETDYSLYYHPNYSFPRIFRDYVDDFVKNIIEDLKITRESRILEIGCGDGFFLSRLRSALSTTNMVGFDPAYSGHYDMNRFIQTDFYRPNEEKFDFIFMRNTFEQLVEYETVLKDVLKKVINGARLVIETPDIGRILEYGDHNFFSQEYHRLFSLQALNIMANLNGLEIYSTYRLLEERHLVVVFKAAPFYKELPIKKVCYKDLIKTYSRIVVWGATSKTVALLADAGLNTDIVQFAVDIDRRLTNHYIPVTGQRILNPSQAKKYDPNLVIITDLQALEEIKLLFGERCAVMMPDGTIHLHK